MGFPEAELHDNRTAKSHHFPEVFIWGRQTCSSGNDGPHSAYENRMFVCSKDAETVLTYTNQYGFRVLSLLASLT